MTEPIVPGVYLAGPMYPDGSGPAPWRKFLMDEIPDSLTEWVTPESYGKHGGDCEYVVAEDLGCIRGSSGVVAWVDNADRAGTMVEIGYALGWKRPVLLLHRGDPHSKRGGRFWFAYHACTTTFNIPRSKGPWWLDKKVGPRVVAEVRSFVVSLLIPAKW